MGVSGVRRGREGYVLFDDAVKPFVVESAVGGDHAAGAMLWSMLAASIDGSVEDDRWLTLPLLQWTKTGCCAGSFKTTCTWAIFSSALMRSKDLCALIGMRRCWIPFFSTKSVASGEYGSSTRVLDHRQPLFSRHDPNDGDGHDGLQIQRL